LLLKAENPNLQRKSFIKELAFQLSEKHAKLRHTENNHLPQPVKDAGSVFFKLLSTRPNFFSHGHS